MKYLITILVLFVVVFFTALNLKRDNDKKLYDEFKRGLMVGAGYYQKYGLYPSYYKWNKKFYYPDFDIDDTTGEAAGYQKALKEMKIWKRGIDSAFEVENNVLKLRK